MWSCGQCYALPLFVSQLSIKNISENPLNFQADELTERIIPTVKP